MLELIQQECIGAKDFDAVDAKLADAEDADVLGDEDDHPGVGIEVTGQDGCSAGCDVGVFGGAHRWRHAGELGLDPVRRDFRRMRPW